MTYYELVEDDSKSNFQFDQTGGSGKGPYITAAGGPLQDIIREIIGYTNPFAGPTQALRRTIPVTHPKFPYLYASRISSMVGKGTKGAVREAPTPPNNAAIGAKPIADYLLYPMYDIGIEFASRPYPVLADTAFTNTFSGTWYKRNGDTNTFTYAPEWCRYVDYDLFPQDNTVQGQQGSMSLWGIPGKAAGVPFTSPPWMWLPDQILKINWYQVPYRFITSSNSYIAGTPERNWRGRVNQNTWWNWGAGSLLYLGYAVKKYTPPTMDIGYYPTYTGNVDYTTGAVTKSVLGTLIHYERLCDIELTFLLTNRFMSGTLGATIQNKNHVPAGHNLLPNLADNRFYYGTRTPLKQDGTNGTPSVQNPPAWFSFPVEALFSDPDVPGGPTTAGDN